MMKKSKKLVKNELFVLKFRWGLSKGPPPPKEKTLKSKKKQHTFEKRPKMAESVAKGGKSTNPRHLTLQGFLNDSNFF